MRMCHVNIILQNMIQKIFYNNSKDTILVFFYISLSTTLFTFYYDQTEISYIGKFFAKNNELSAFIETIV